jgi:hypothetical protein
VNLQLAIEQIGALALARSPTSSISRPIRRLPESTCGTGHSASAQMAVEMWEGFRS